MKTKSHKGKKIIIIAIAMVLTVVSAYSLIRISSIQALTGSDWRAGRIIDDQLFTNKNATAVAHIQSFLESRMPNCDTNGTQMHSSGVTRAQYGASRGNPAPFTCLRDYYENPITKANNYGGQPIPAGAKSAAQLIWEAGQQYNINPQVLVVTLQKEQGLISDDWPFKNQFLYAMGAHCPDSGPGGSANCDPAYAGFSIQMLEAAELFRYYLDNMNQPWWPYAKPGSRSVLYNPSSACGSSNVFIENYSTAALYTYTPYQPNAAALNNLSGSGDGCSAYGNRNFWRDFNNWFGPTTSNGYTLSIADNGDPRQWVIMNGKRHLVPDTAIKQAWGLPDIPITWDDQYLGSFPDGPNLTRLMRPNGTLNVYLVDSGKRYRIPSTQMLDVWNISIVPIVDVSVGLGELPTDTGDLSYTARRLSDAAVYLIDSGVKRHITNGDVLKAWSGDAPNVISLSDSFFNNNLTTGGAISSPKITYGVNTYLVDGGRKLLMDNVTAQLYPSSWNSHSVTPAIYNLFGTQSLTYFIKAWNSPDIYLIDQGAKHHITDPNVLDAWQSSSFPSGITTITMGMRDFISTGVQIADYFASSGGNKFVIEKYKRLIPSVLHNSYTSNRTVYPASDTLLSVFPAGSEVSGFVKTSGSSEVYLLTKSGSRRSFINSNRLKLWTQHHLITELRSVNLERYPHGGGINAFVTDGMGNNYLIEGGLKHVIDASTKSNWRLGTPDALDDDTLSLFNNGTQIVNKLKSGAAYFFIHEGVAYGSIDRNIAEMWGTVDAPDLSTALINEYLGSNMMTRIVKSNVSNDSRLFIIDRGNLYRLYPNHALNLSAHGPFTAVNPNVMTVYDWTATVVKDEGGTMYAINSGTKRLIPSGIIRDQWTFGNLANAPTMTNGFLNTLPTTTQMERAVKGSGPNIYAVQNYRKRWIQNPNTYSSNFAPYTLVSDALLGALIDGDPL